MNSRYLVNLLLILFFVMLLVGCQGLSEPAATQTPEPTLIPTLTPTNTPIPTPAPALDVLDWHLAFSSDSQINTVRCEVLQSLGSDSTQEILQPLPIRLMGTLLTPQIIEESLIILRISNPLLAERIENRPSIYNSVYTVLNISTLSGEDTYNLPESSESRDSNPNQVRFSVQSISLLANTQRLSASEEFLTIGNFYLIQFPMNERSLLDITDIGNVELSLEIAAIPHLQNRFCNSTTPYQLNLSISSGDARVMPRIYGDMQFSMNAGQLRFEILTRLLPEILRQDEPIDENIETETET